jgi:protein-arginine kinase activator protein McsA
MLCDVCREREGVVSVTKMEKDSVTLENLCEASRRPSPCRSIR